MSDKSKIKCQCCKEEFTQIMSEAFCQGCLIEAGIPRKPFRSGRCFIAPITGTRTPKWLTIPGKKKKLLIYPSCVSALNDMPLYAWKRKD